METGQHSKAIAPYEEVVRLKPDNLTALFNLPLVCDQAEEVERRKTWSETAIPVFQRHIKLHPEDENARVNQAVLFFWSGRKEDAHREAVLLKQARDGVALYNTACLLMDMAEPREALETFRKAIDAGLRNIRALKGFLAGDDIASLAGTPEYEEVMRMVEKIEAEAEENLNGG
jgi:tetratricopeptide (TPR) repeat protein